jgi:3-phosphoshikimate 1-carboxyvinyltransferase
MVFLQEKRMNKFRISPSKLHGKVSIPASKSHTLRAILFALMAKGKSTIRHYLPSPDAQAMIGGVREFGAKVEVFDERLEIEGVAGILNAASNVIESGNSGQVLRFLGGLAGLAPTYTVITGDASIRTNRPVVPLLEALQQLGAFAVSSRLDGYAPIIVKGKMQPGKTRLSGEDSQPVSALLIACSFLKGKTEIDVINPGEKPWIELTLSWLKRFGVQVENHNYTRYIVHGHASYEGFDLTVPGDFSSAAYPIVAALITGSEVTVENIDMTDVQGDKKLIEVLIQMGARIEIDGPNRRLIVKKGERLKGMKIDINDFIDAITILAVVGCFADGKTEIVNAAIARKKESDRIHTIAAELRKMGANIEETPDGLIVQTSALKGAHCISHHDHRIAMSLAVAALAAEGESMIDGVECVSKSYPGFAKDMQILKAEITTI